MRLAAAASDDHVRIDPLAPPPCRPAATPAACLRFGCMWLIPHSRRAARAVQPGVRSRKYRVVIALEWGSNRLARWALRAGLAPRAFALLETTGRRTGLARHTPVGNGLSGDTFWLVAAHGTQADYVRNLQTEPRVLYRSNTRLSG